MTFLSYLFTNTFHQITLGNSTSFQIANDGSLNLEFSFDAASIDGIIKPGETYEPPANTCPFQGIPPHTLYVRAQGVGNVCYGRVWGY
jgi:hypothetical protein